MFEVSIGRNQAKRKEVIYFKLNLPVPVGAPGLSVSLVIPEPGPLAGQLIPSVPSYIECIGLKVKSHLN